MTDEQPEGGGEVYEFMGLRSKTPLTLDSVNRLLIKEVVRLRCRLEYCKEDEKEAELRDQVHELRVQLKMAQLEEKTAKEAAGKLRTRLVEKTEEARMENLIRMEERGHYEENLRVILTNSRVKDLRAEEEIAQLRARCSASEEALKQLQKEHEESEAILNELRKAAAEIIPEEVVAEADMETAQLAETLAEKIQELEGQLSSARDKVLHLESLQHPDPVIIFREIGNTDVQKEEENTDVQKEEENTDLQKEEETTDLQKKEETTGVHKKEETMDVQKEEETTGVHKKEETMDVQKEEENTDVQTKEETTDVQKEEATDVQKKEEIMDVQKEEDIDVQKEEENTDMQKKEETTDVQKEEGNTDIKQNDGDLVSEEISTSETNLPNNDQKKEIAKQVAQATEATSSEKGRSIPARRDVVSLHEHMLNEWCGVAVPKSSAKAADSRPKNTGTFRPSEDAVEQSKMPTYAHKDTKSPEIDECKPQEAHYLEQIAELKKDKAAASQEIESWKSRMAGYQDKIGMLEKDKDATRLEIEEYESQKVHHLGQITILQNNKDAMLQEIDEYKSHMADCQEKIDMLEKDKDAARLQVKEYESQKIRYQGQITMLQKDKAAMSQEIEEYKSQKADNLEQIGMLEKDQAAARLQIEEYESQKVRYQGQITMLQKDKATMSQEIEENKSQKAHNLEQIGMLEKDKDAARLQIEEYESQKVRYQGQITMLQKDKAAMSQEIEEYKSQKAHDLEQNAALQNNKDAASLEIEEYKSQKIKYLGQITMLQNDKSNLQKEKIKLEEDLVNLEATVKTLQDVNSQRIKAISMVELLEREKIKKDANSEALETTVKFLTEELEYSKLRNRDTVGKLVQSEQEKKELQEQVTLLQGEDSRRIGSSTLPQDTKMDLSAQAPVRATDVEEKGVQCDELSGGEARTRSLDGLLKIVDKQEDKLVDAVQEDNKESESVANSKASSPKNMLSASELSGAQEQGLVVQVEADMGGSASPKRDQLSDIGSSDKQLSTNRDVVSSTSEQARALGEQLSFLATDLQVERMHTSDNFQEIISVFQSTIEHENEATRVYGAPDSGSENQELSAGASSSPQTQDRSCQTESKEEVNLEQEVETLRSMLEELAESKKFLSSRVTEQGAENTELKIECERLRADKEQQSQEWAESMSDLKILHEKELSSCEDELEKVKTALDAAKTECVNLKEEIVKSLMVMAEITSEKDGLKSALGVCDMTQRNLKELSQDVKEILTTNLNTTNKELADVRIEKSTLLEKIADLESARRERIEVQERLTKDMEALRESNSILKSQVQMLEKKDKENEANLESVTDDGKAAKLMYENHIQLLAQENHQLTESNDKLTQSIRENHLYSQMMSLEGNVNSLRTSLTRINTLIDTFNSLSKQVTNEKMTLEEAWACMSKTVAFCKSDEPVTSTAAPQIQEPPQMEERALNPRVQLGWYEPSCESSTRGDSSADRPPSRSRSEGSGAGGGASSTSSSSKKSPLKTDPGASVPKGKKTPQKGSKQKDKGKDKVWKF